MSRGLIKTAASGGAETEAEDCYEHDCPQPCVKCQADADWRVQLDYARSLEQQADAVESMTLSNQEDREHLRAFANELRKRASVIIGGLQREADREAREAEDARERPHKQAYGF